MNEIERINCLLLGIYKKEKDKKEQYYFKEKDKIETLASLHYYKVYEKNVYSIEDLIQTIWLRLYNIFNIHYFEFENEMLYNELIKKIINNIILEYNKSSIL